MKYKIKTFLSNIAKSKIDGKGSMSEFNIPDLVNQIGGLLGIIKESVNLLEDKTIT